MKTLEKKLSDDTQIKGSIKGSEWAKNIDVKSSWIVILSHLLRLSGEPYPCFDDLIQGIREGFKNIDKVERELINHLTDELYWLDKVEDSESYQVFSDNLQECLDIDKELGFTGLQLEQEHAKKRSAAEAVSHKVG